MFDIFVQEVMGPMIAEHGSIDDIFLFASESAIHHLMKHLGMSVEEAGVRLGKSRTWAYKVLADAEARRKERAKEDAATGAAVLRNTSLRYDIMTYLPSNFPHFKSVAEISEGVGEKPEKVLIMLEALRKAGLLEWEEGKYRAPDKVVTTGTDIKERVVEAAGTAITIGHRYAEGAPDTMFVRAQLRLLPEVLSETVGKISDFTREVFDDGVLKTRQLDPDGMRQLAELKGFICLGKEVKK